MTKINPPFSLGYACIAILCLSACAGDKPSKPVNLTRSGILPNGSVVLLDPTTDDSMLPALGEGLSRGAVTIYNLDGPQAPLPVRSAPPAPVAIGYAGNGGMSQTAAPGIQLREPTGMAQDNDGTDDSARVTIFGLDSGTPVTKRPVPVLAPSPNLPPPVDLSQPLTASPFTTNKEGAVVLDNKPATTKKSSTKTKSKSSVKTTSAPTPIALPPGTTTLGAGSRAVMATDLMKDTATSPMPPPLLPYPAEEAVARPPKGMTY